MSNIAVCSLVAIKCSLAACSKPLESETNMEYGMFLKVPSFKKDGEHHDTSLEEVQEAVSRLAPDVQLEVSDAMRMPTVHFEANATIQEFRQVEAALNAAGFEAY